MIDAILEKGDQRNDLLTPRERQIYNVLQTFLQAVEEGDCKLVEEYFNIFKDDFYDASDESTWFGVQLSLAMFRSTPEMLWCIYRIDPRIYLMKLFGEDTLLESWVGDFEITVDKEGVWRDGKHILNTLLMIDYYISENPKLNQLTDDDFDSKAYAFDAYFLQFFYDGLILQAYDNGSQMNYDEALFVITNTDATLDQLVEMDVVSDEALHIFTTNLLYSVDKRFRDNPIYDRQILDLISRYSSPKRKRSN